MRNKVFAKTKDGLYEKLFEKYYGEKTKTLGELFPEAEAWYAERKNSCSKTVLGDAPTKLPPNLTPADTSLPRA